MNATALSAENDRRLYREGLITAAEIAMECGAVLVAKAIRDHAKNLTDKPAPTPGEPA